MKHLFDHADEIPVTLLVVLAYVTMAFLTDPFSPTGEQLFEFGSLSPIAASEGEPWRLLASAFLHGGLLHLGLNTWAMLAIGPTLERNLGSVRFAVLYVISALGASLAVCLLYQVQQPVVGGSGALFGMLGAVVALQMRQGRHALSFLDYEGPRRVLGLIAINLVIGLLVPFISNTAHVGGLITGFVLTSVWLVSPRAAAPSAAGRIGAWRAATAALLLGLLFHSLMPVTRYDWLWNRGVHEANPLRQRALQRAAVMSYLGIAEATATDIQRFQILVLEPQSKRGG